MIPSGPEKHAAACRNRCSPKRASEPLVVTLASAWPRAGNEVPPKAFVASLCSRRTGVPNLRRRRPKDC
eukprot:4849490-Pyramimonas_sp.AAC.1